MHFVRHQGDPMRERTGNMKVLFLAPQPFYQERGTPIAVRQLTTALAQRGWSVDLLVFPEGADVTCPNLRVLRVRRLPGVRNVPPGLSIKKILYDVPFFFKALGLAWRNRYDMVHAVEESAFMAHLICLLTRTPYVYDMDSSLPEQVVMKCPALKVVAPAMRWMEGLALRRASLVLAVCDALADAARRQGVRRVMILRDPPLGADGKATPAASATEPARPSGPVRFVYIGNLAKYQGIDLLLQSFARPVIREQAAVLTIVGGTPAEIETYQVLCRRLGIADRVEFRGAQPIVRIGEIMAAADVLVSPRTEGVNTPMKIYSYLHSGKAVLATDIPAHTQVIELDAALLVPPEPGKMAEGMARLAAEPTLRANLGRKAAELARAKYSAAAYQKTVDEFCLLVESLARPSK